MVTLIIIIAILVIIWKLSPNPNDKRATGMMFQMLESFHIIDTTENQDVFTKRLDFIGKLACTLPTNANKQKCIENAITAYNHKYPAIPISPTIRIILKNPEVATSAKFRDEATTAFYLRTCHKLKSEIVTLKTRAAKQRRINQASGLAEILIGQMTSPEKQKYIDCILNELATISSLSTL